MNEQGGASGDSRPRESRDGRLPGADATKDLGRRLAGLLPADTSGWMILLRGELGAGKSTLARALLQALGHRGPVPSPTYTLVEPYEIGPRLVYHVDLYRISGESELAGLGWAELDQGLILVEWPERVPALREQADLEIRLGFADDGREVRMTALAPRAAGIVRELGRAAETGFVES